MNPDLNPPLDVDLGEGFKEETKAVKPKRKVNRAQLNESTLLQQNKGLKRLYLITKEIKPTGNIKQDLTLLLTLYKEWHFIVAGKFEFNYFVQKCQVLGTKAPVRGYMNRLREFHSGRIGEYEFDNPVSMQVDDDLEQEQVYESPEKLIDSVLQNSENRENRENRENNENKDELKGNQLRLEAKDLDYFDIVEEPGEADLDDEMEYLRQLENGEFKDDFVQDQGGGMDELVDLQDIVLDGSGKRPLEEEDSMERKLKEK